MGGTQRRRLGVAGPDQTRRGVPPGGDWLIVHHGGEPQVSTLCALWRRHPLPADRVHVPSLQPSVAVSSAPPRTPSSQFAARVVPPLSTPEGATMAPWQETSPSPFDMAYASSWTFYCACRLWMRVVSKKKKLVNLQDYLDLSCNRNPVILFPTQYAYWPPAEKLGFLQKMLHEEQMAFRRPVGTLVGRLMLARAEAEAAGATDSFAGGHCLPPFSVGGGGGDGAAVGGGGGAAGAAAAAPVSHPRADGGVFGAPLSQFTDVGMGLVLLGEPASTYSAAAAGPSSPVLSQSLPEGPAQNGSPDTFVYETVCKSTVAISAAFPDGSTCGGTGLVWDDAGRVLTNWHVVSKSDQVAGDIKVTFVNEKTCSAEVVFYDARNDISLLRVHAPASEFVPISKREPVPAAGEIAYAVGCPLGLPFSIKNGSIGGPLRCGVFPGGLVYHLVQVNVDIKKGFSGGPLVDSSCRLVGMMTWLPSEEGGSSFAHSASTLTQFVTLSMAAGVFFER